MLKLGKIKFRYLKIQFDKEKHVVLSYHNNNDELMFSIVNDIIVPPRSRTICIEEYRQEITNEIVKNKEIFSILITSFITKKLDYLLCDYKVLVEKKGDKFENFPFDIEKEKEFLKLKGKKWTN